MGDDPIDAGAAVAEEEEGGREGGGSAAKRRRHLPEVTAGSEKGSVLEYRRRQEAA